MRPVNIQGKKFNKLTAIERIGTKGGKSLWRFKCDCGNTTETTAWNATKGLKKSCGCSTTDRAQNKPKNILGQKFGRLTVVSFLGTKNRRAYWNAQCDCGNVIAVQGKYLRQKKVSSCGCYAEYSRKTANLKHGALMGGKTIREYRIWAGMITRCTNTSVKAYKNYGGRGISVCASWRESFQQFLADMGMAPEGDYSIDRINNDGNYEPSNCRWATRKEQSNNCRPRSKKSGLCKPTEVKMTYIQRKDAHYLETVDEFESMKEAKAMLAEYRMGDRSAYYYLSRRACKAWRES